MRFLLALQLLGFLVLDLSASTLTAQEFLASELDFFEQKIRPLLIEHCFECHSSDSKEDNGGLLLDSREAILTGGSQGPAVNLIKVDGSLLLKAVHYRDPNFEMPPQGKLSQSQIALLEQWVSLGLPFPASQANSRKKREVDIEAGRKHWAFLPLQESQVPASASDDPWCQTTVDAFIRSKQKDHGLEPNPPATKANLLRRAKLNLLGLPPTLEEVRDFVSDDSPNALVRLIEKWLAQPQYGERWARPWLELVRYCDVPEQWAEVNDTFRYRDWVVQALNEDMPYDRFVMLQLAADQMQDARPTDLAALGFIGLSPTYWKELQLPVEIIKSIVSDEYEERIHSWSSTFLGVNLACARCHDHKFDPFTTKDYYAIAGVFANSRQINRVLDHGVDSLKVIEAKKTVAANEPKLAKLTSEINELRVKQEDKSISAEQITELANKEAESQKLQEIIKDAQSTPGFHLPVAPGTIDSWLEVQPLESSHGSRIVYVQASSDAAIEIRGNPNKLGEKVPRRYLEVLSSGEMKPFSRGSGRLDLAESMFQNSSHLLARVIVNRVWYLHMGQGIVPTTSDFGTQGDPPSHPELLDNLAARFINNNWSLKWLHKEIMLSATYQQSCDARNSSDPSNAYYTRYPTRRLDVEAWRDTIMQANQTLDLQLGGPPIDLASKDNHRRTIYGTITRRELTDLLRLYDFPDPVTHSPNRINTSTALQQLFVLNSPFIANQAQSLIQRLDRELKTATDSTLTGEQNDLAKKRIEQLYQWLFARQPTEDEMKLGLGFISDSTELQWQLYAQVLLGSNELFFLD